MLLYLRKNIIQIAKILTKQRSLYVSAFKYILLASAVAIIGRLLLPVSVFITIVSLVAFFFILRKSFNYLMGAIGEHLVTKEIKKFGDDYYLINDVEISGKQTDHILICPKGVYIIETKTYFFNVYDWFRYWKLYKNG